MSGDADISNIISELTKVNAVEEGFSPFLIVNPEEDAARLKSLEQDLASALKRHPSEFVDAALKQLAHAISVQVVHFRARKLFALLQSLISSNVVPARKVCDALLANEKLSPYNEYYWNGTFLLIQKIISEVDYKGVREVMKVCLEKAHLLPLAHDLSLQPQVIALQKVLEVICDRNECLLPAYFVVNEIQKMYPENRNWPHWSLAPVLMNSIDSFRPLAQMLSVVGRSSLLPIVDHSLHAGHYAWKMENGTVKFCLKGNLPYDKEYQAPQTNLIKHVLQQPYSRETVLAMLGLQKQHKQRSPVLEQLIVENLVDTMEEYERNGGSHHGVSSVDENGSPIQEELGMTHWMWHHMSSQMIYFVLFSFASFPHVVNSLHEKLTQKNLRKGRDHLMWVLLQFVSGSIQKNQLADFLPVLKLFDHLYPEREPIPVPDVSHAVCVHQMAATCIWMHLAKKAVGPQDQTTLKRAFPNCLKLQYEFLVAQSQSSNTFNVSPNDYRIALLCNAYSTTPDILTRPMNAILDTIQKSVISSSPLALALLDSLTVHAKMSLIHGIVTGIIKSATMKNNTPLPPALVETYSRLLVYMEIESLGIKGFISQLLPAVFKPQAWVILHTLLEMFSYRLHHVLPQYRIQLLAHLHSLAEVVQSNQTQLNLCIENAALRLIMGLGSAEFQQPHLSRLLSDPKSYVWKESEELNRAFILTLARTINITGIDTGTWCGEILRLILQSTPHTWSPNTLNCFPPAIAELFTQGKATRESKQQLKMAVDQEYSRWSGMNNEGEIVNHFAMQGTPPLFLCIVWRMLLETGHVNPIAYTVLDRIGARALSSHVRYFCDFLVYEFANSGGGQHVNKFVEIVNDIVWKYNIVTIDKLILCLALRPLEGNEAQVCFYIIQLLLLKPQEFRNRVHEFVKDHSPDHWKQNGWHDKHQSFLRKHPEKFGSENMTDIPGSGHLPIYFGNVCLRFLPVFDIVIHRYIEIPSVAKSLDSILDHLGCLYKFHDRPMTYLYQSLHYYDKKLSDRLPLKRRIASFIFQSLKDVRPKNWCFTEAFQQYLNLTPRSIQQQGDDGQNWQPDLEHFVKLVGMLVDTISGKSPCPFPLMDWRFNEFPNMPTHALYVTAVEILSLPVSPQIAGSALIDTVMKGYPLVDRASINEWINAIGLILAALPESYWCAFHDRCCQMLESTVLLHWPYQASPFQVFNWKEASNYHHDPQWVQFMAICHSVWHHATPGQISLLPSFVSERLKPLIKKEEQILYLFHLIGPSLQRLHTEKTNALIALTVELYEILEQVDRHAGAAPLKHMDMICDLLYHIKYMFTGDQVKASIEPIIKNMRPALRGRLRYITHLSAEEIRSSASVTSLTSLSS